MASVRPTPGLSVAGTMPSAAVLRRVAMTQSGSATELSIWLRILRALTVERRRLKWIMRSPCVAAARTRGQTIERGANHAIAGRPLRMMEVLEIAMGRGMQKSTTLEARPAWAKNLHYRETPKRIGGLFDAGR
jgi:hypothetical protein